MDKKNTMLLTVIAVATLLVAVVGATFAYFSISATSSVSNAKIEATTDNIGAIAVAPGDSMPKLTLKLEHFANTSGVQEWHSSATGEPAQSDQEIPVVKANVTGGGSNVTYACTGTLKVELTDNYEDLAGKTGEAVLTLTGAADDVKLGAVTANASEESIDFSDYTEAKNYQLTFEVADTNTVSKDKNVLNADLVVKNTTSKQQGYLAGKTLGAQITVENVTCAPKAAQ